MYGELFVYCLKQHNMLCWGVYRLKDSHSSPHKSGPPGNNRYVICNPSADFRLIPNDLVYVLQQFNPNYSKTQTQETKENQQFEFNNNDNNNNNKETDASINNLNSNYAFKKKYSSQSNMRRNFKSLNTMDSTKKQSISDDLDELNDRYQSSFENGLENIQMLNRLKSVNEKKYQVRV